jgi:hypothetical protein
MLLRNRDAEVFDQERVPVDGLLDLPGHRPADVVAGAGVDPQQHRAGAGLAVLQRRGERPKELARGLLK